MPKLMISDVKTPLLSEYDPLAVENAPSTNYCYDLHYSAVNLDSVSPNGINVNDFAVTICRSFYLKWFIAASILIISVVSVNLYFTRRFNIDTGISIILYVVAAIAYIWMILYHINLYYRFMDYAYCVSYYLFFAKIPLLFILIALFVLIVTANISDKVTSTIVLYLTIIVDISFAASYWMSIKKVGYDVGLNKVEIRKSLYIATASTGSASVSYFGNNLIINLAYVRDLQDLLTLYYQTIIGNVKVVDNVALQT